MDEPFQIPVHYGGKDYLFDAQLFTTTYQYKIEVIINEVPFHFERDDEGSFRAIAVKPNDISIHKTDPALLQAVADTLQEILS